MLLVNKRIRQIAIGLTVLSLFVSAVSACACSHHSEDRSAELAGTSCHGAEHAEVRVRTEKTPVPSGSFVGEDCSCFVRTPVQAIPSNAEKKAKVADISDDILSIEIERFEFDTKSAANNRGFDRTISHHSNPRFRSGPARAPPRL